MGWEGRGGSQSESVGGDEKMKVRIKRGDKLNEKVERNKPRIVTSREVIEAMSTILKRQSKVFYPCQQF